FGRDPTLTIDRILDPSPKSVKTDLRLFKESLTTTLRDAWNEAAIRSREAQAVYQKKANEGAQGSIIKAGDRVMYKDYSNHKGLSRKLVLPWTGDFRVVEVNPPTATIYDRRDSRKPERIVHLDQIKKISSSEEDIDTPVTEADAVANDGTNSEVGDKQEEVIRNPEPTVQTTSKTLSNQTETSPDIAPVRRNPQRQRKLPAKFKT
uniref:Integrase-type domain-containing protein n=1 Tax=Caenorhabditis japonica TaxID=281687 RepID=A0A8R1IMV3_CAEJA